MRVLIRTIAGDKLEFDGVVTYRLDSSNKVYIVKFLEPDRVEYLTVDNLISFSTFPDNSLIGTNAPGYNESDI